MNENFEWNEMTFNLDNLLKFAEFSLHHHLQIIS